MAGKRRRFKPYELFGRTVNLPDAVARVKGDTLSVPDTCRFCKGAVKMINNAEVYGREFGWPLTYRCECCGARYAVEPAALSAGPADERHQRAP